jgi:hypothetical protein
MAASRVDVNRWHEGSHGGTPLPGARASRSTLLASATLLVVLAGAVGFWWERRIEAGVNPATVRFTAYDDYDYYYPTSRYAFDELRAGRFPLWSPYQHAGAPFFATAQPGILYPPNLLHLSLSTAVAEKIAALLHLTIAGFGAALLGRAWRQSWPAATATGVAFAFAPSVTGRLPAASPLRRRVDPVAAVPAPEIARLAEPVAVGTHPRRLLGPAVPRRLSDVLPDVGVPHDRLSLLVALGAHGAPPPGGDASPRPASPSLPQPSSPGA